MSYDDDEGYGQPENECGPCSRGGGALLAVLGVGLAYMGADLLTGGAITRALFGAARAAVPGPLADNEVTDQDQDGDTPGDPDGD